VEFKKYLGTTVAATALLAFSAPIDANAGSIAANNSKIDLKVGGRVHKTLTWADDGYRDGLFHTDGLTTNTEMWLSGSAKLTEAVTMGALQRWDLQNQNAKYNFDSSTGAKETTATTSTGKYSYVYFKHSSMGTLTIGDAEPGANGTMNKHGGTFVADPGGGGSSVHFTTGSDGVGSGATIGDFLAYLDPGSDGNNRVVYNAPAMGGFSLGADFEQDGGGSVGVKWAGTVSGLTTAVGAGFEADGSGNSKTGGSVAVSHANGMHVAINYGEYDQDIETTTATDYDTMRIVAGYKTSVNSLGSTNISVSYLEADGVTGTGDEGESIQVGIGQALDAVGGNIKLTYDQISASDSAANDYNDIDVINLDFSFNF